MSSQSKKKLRGRIYADFIAGIVVTAPIAITIWLCYWFITGPVAWVDGFVQNNLRTGITGQVSTIYIPGIGIILALLFIWFLGFFARNVIGRSFLSWSEKLLHGMPVVSNIYAFLKNVFTSVLSQKDKVFRDVALVEFPLSGSFAMCFIVTETKGDVHAGISSLQADGLAGKEKFYNVFVPTSPNPTSGFLLFVPESRLKRLDYTAEEGAKVIFSAGMIDPKLEKRKKDKKPPDTGAASESTAEG